ncbi:metallo-beta-lactamase family protein [Dactylonectria macrodidyma]|uniref:Metallo-beta-lactamase family protein n=1 Tax=Dactylonectria macrodidyma TaxID=307937 RepID=A0A9P9DW08_9HYPO|nr:metallo-beta-lactamase family protein [Dactylonectria macrodidyma]
MKLNFFVALGAIINSATARPSCKNTLRVETFLNTGPSLEVVSSLIIGSEAAVIIDLPLAIPQAEALAEWVRNTTDKPLVAAFSTHSHPDHYLGGAAFLDRFPDAKYYANSKVVEFIANEAPHKAEFWRATLGDELVVDNVTIPTPYDFTFFALPGDEGFPIHLVSPLVGDTIDETLFWIPSISTLIAGDAVYSHDMHLWLADLLTPALTEAWLSTLDFVESLKPRTIIPGHSLSSKKFGSNVDLEHTRKYVTYFKNKIQSKGEDFFTPKEIYKMLNSAFPHLLPKTSQTSAFLLNFTSEQFGRGGQRQIHYVDLASFNNLTELEGWKI